jgi:hypothetical protein
VIGIILLAISTACLAAWLMLYDRFGLTHGWEWLIEHGRVLATGLLWGLVAGLCFVSLGLPATWHRRRAASGLLCGLCVLLALSFTLACARVRGEVQVHQLDSPTPHHVVLVTIDGLSPKAVLYVQDSSQGALKMHGYCYLECSGPLHVRKSPSVGRYLIVGQDNVPGAVVDSIRRYIRTAPLTAEDLSQEFGEDLQDETTAIDWD